MYFIMDENKRRNKGEKIRNSCKSRPLRRAYTRLATKGIFYATPLFLLFSEVGRERLKDPETWKKLVKPERRIGMLEGAIISDSQYIPDIGNTNFTYESEKLGYWIGVDYLRVQELGRSSKKISRGKFLSFPLEEVEGKTGDEYTPTHLFDLFDPLHLFRLQNPTLDELVKDEFIEPTSYSDALRRVGQYEGLANKIAITGIEDKEVYQVTPKGNSLIFLTKPMGDTKKRPKEDTTPVYERPQIA